MVRYMALRIISVLNRTVQQQPPKKTIMITGDSNTRGLAGMIENKDIDVSGTVRPGVDIRRLEESIENDITPQTDMAFVNVGINNINCDRESNEEDVKYLMKKVNDQFPNCTFFFLAVPPSRNPEDQEAITHLNDTMKEKAGQFNNTQFLDPRLRYSDMKPRGVHLTARGKDKIAQCITNCTKNNSSL